MYFLWWCHQESNRGHKDFQSFALPTELWHHCFSFAVAKVVKLLDSASLMEIKNTDKKLVCLLSVLYELKIFLLLTGIFYLSSFSGFQPWAFSSNSCPSRVIKAQPSSGLVICPMRRIPSICETFSWSAIGTVKRSS